MATSCPVSFDIDRLRSEVARIYSLVAREPEGDFHFHRGPDYAARLLGYDRSELAALPAAATAAFAGVANPHLIEPLRPGEIVVDVGSGAGTDILLAARRVGPGGRAIGVDMTADMIAAARRAAADAGLANVDIRPGTADALPVADASADVVISNGVINLTPDKGAAFGEIHRVLRPGGRLLLGDIVIARELAEDLRADIDLWTG